MDEPHNNYTDARLKGPHCCVMPSTYTSRKCERIATDRKQNHGSLGMETGGEPGRAGEGDYKATRGDF